jgi:phosphate transport system permease protein
MSDATHVPVKDIVARGLKRRYRNEQTFRLLGLAALGVGLAFLGFFFYTLIANGYTAFGQTRIRIDVELRSDALDPDGTRSPDVLARANYLGILRESFGKMFPEVTARGELRELHGMLSPGAALELRERVLANPAVVGTTQSLWLLADDDIDMVVKGHIRRDVAQTDRRVSDAEIRWLDRLIAEGRIELQFNRYFFGAGASSDPELAGIWRNSD